MEENLQTTLELKESQLRYLEKMAEKYALPNRDKALRCLIAFAMQETENEQSIFSEIRCLNC